MSARATFHFNELSEGQAERLVVLAEEASEVIKAICKIQRHGYESHNPDDKGYGLSNRQTLQVELGHFLTAVARMVAQEDLDPSTIEDWADEKMESGGYYLHHQPKEDPESPGLTD